MSSKRENIDADKLRVIPASEIPANVDVGAKNIGAKNSVYTLRMPTVTNKFIEKAIADTQNKKSDLLLAASILVSSFGRCLDNEIDFRPTFKITRQRKILNRNLKTLSKSSELLVDLSSFEAAGITQEMLNNFLEVISLFADYSEARKAELDEEEKGK